MTFGGVYSTAFALFMAVTVAMSTLGAANGSCSTSGRLTLAAARNKHMPHIFSYLSLQQRLPILAIVFNTVISIIMVIPESANFNSLGMVSQSIRDPLTSVLV